MSFITNRLTKTITRWTRGTPDGFSGFTWDRSTIKARWEDRAEQEISPSGEVFVSRAIVYVKTDVELGDFLFNGISTASDPTTVRDAREVRQFRKIPTLNYSKFERKATL